MGCWKVRMVYSSALHYWSSIVFPNSLINAVNIFAVWKKLRPTFPRRVDQHRHGHQGRGGLLRSSFKTSTLGTFACQRWNFQLRFLASQLNCQTPSWWFPVPEWPEKKQSWNWMAGMATILVWRQRKLWISSRDYWISQIIASFWTWTSQVKAS